MSRWAQEWQRPGPVRVFRRFVDRKPELVLGLTLTQQVIIRRLVKGQKVATIAADLDMTPNAVYSQLAKVREKTGTHNRNEVIRWARDHPEVLEES